MMATSDGKTGLECRKRASLTYKFFPKPMGFGNIKLHKTQAGQGIRSQSLIRQSRFYPKSSPKVKSS